MINLYRTWSSYLDKSILIWFGYNYGSIKSNYSDVRDFKFKDKKKQKKGDGL